ncbi:MAG TPA: FtsX-like permease family protein [Bacteroidales bacterium]|nr:FtsX-like permease family protein [Bacteroidales bacterium]
MKFNKIRIALFISWRYLFSKKKHNIINIISLISVIGIMVSSAALIIVLSVFNGLEDLVSRSFNQFNPDYEITIKEGKSFNKDLIHVDKILKINNISSVQEVVSDLTLLVFNDKQLLTNFKGVSKEYPQKSKIDQLIYDGSFDLSRNNQPTAVLGATVAGTLNIQLNGFDFLKFYYPKRNKKNLSNPLEAFQILYIQPSGVFLTHTQYDEQYVFVPIEFARELGDYENQVTSYEVFLKKESSAFSEQKEIEKIVGDQFLVKNKFQQEELLFKTMKSEKLMVFVILSFVILVAVFNIIGVIGMLIVEKKKDIEILNTLGSGQPLIRSVFLMEGILISLIGGVFGSILGFILCFLQQQFGLVSLGDGSANYIIDHYPVIMNLNDFILVFLSVICISTIVSFISISGLRKYKTNFDFYR